MSGAAAEVNPRAGEADPSDVEELAARAFNNLPWRFRRHLSSLAIRVENFPDAETMTTLRLDSPWSLLGLYRGVALPNKSVLDPRSEPDMVFLYRQPILAYARRRGETLARVVRHVLIHEIGHHFGFSDSDMARIERSR